MPIYAYKCASCGFARDVLQKMSDDPLTQCTSCGAEAFSKQVTAAGFQLKGSGWYVTDFRNGSGAPAPADSSAGTSVAAPVSGSATAPAPAPAKTDSPAPASAPAAAPSAKE